ncbi:hypothetical protein DH2020_035007 [Rehmannia glutinosa]|uniref:FHA domain-containing protein n=1 Tax=Rehmannia glutinosa TaxID=99300 RepID=A0ABR0V9Z6_REHGL
MGAMAPPPHWIPEDDILLKNAVEAGASLESLAKGAVQFSRRYTFKELQDRWCSLLYDPVISIEASAHMIEVERSGFMNQSRPNKFEGVKDIGCSSGKRKAESIRKCYYAMRKRICNEPLNMMDINLLSGPGNSNFGDGNELSSADCRITNPVSNNLEIQGPDFNVRPHSFSEFGPHAAESSGNCVTINTVHSHGQDLPFGGENVSNNLSYPYEDNLFEAESELPSVSLGEAEIAADGHVLGTSGAHPGDSDNKVLRIGPEYRNGVICCTLNTEDPEIPSNEDVFLPFRYPSPSNSSGTHWGMEDPSYLMSSSSVKDFSVLFSEWRTFYDEKQPKNSCMPSRVAGSSQPSDKGSKFPIGDQGVKFELPKSNIQNAAPRNARNIECLSRISSANVTANNKHERGSDVLQSLQKNASGSRNGLDIKAEIPNNGSPNADLSCQNTIDSQPIDTSMLSDQEDWSENDFDVPYFSDVEAMILDMDLSPDEFDLYTNPEVQRYQHEETKRTIIRLEQAAGACTQEPLPVVLGRATEDIKVDIDLGREKDGGKISRRQAIMKMDMHGNFRLKNLGKSSIYVNGTEVATGQSLTLTSGCLIEVKGLAFVFEPNHTLVKQFGDGIAAGSVRLDHKPSNGN